MTPVLDWSSDEGTGLHLSRLESLDGLLNKIKEQRIIIWSNKTKRNTALIFQIMQKCCVFIR